MIVSWNLISRSQMWRLMILVRFTNIGIIIPVNEGYWWLTIRMRIVNDIGRCCRYRPVLSISAITWNLISQSWMRRLMMLVRFTNIGVIILGNERYWTWLTIQVRIVNDIDWCCRYRQSHETWLGIPELKANDVKNLDINISRNILRYYGKKNLIGYFGLEIVNDINRWHWFWDLQ
jgi:hypothetical protein